MFKFDIYRYNKQLKHIQGKVIIANHPTLIDVVVLLAVIPNADCIVKESLWKNPFLKGVVKAAGYIKNSQNVEALLVECSNSLKLGYSLIVFPEGTRSKRGCELKMQRGASNIALRCGADLLPITLKCSPSTLSKSEPWYSIPKTKALFSLVVGNEIKIDLFQQKDLSLSIRARKLTKYIKNYFNGELNRYAKP